MQAEICTAQLGCQVPLRAESLRTHAVPAGHAVHRRVDELRLCRGMTSARTTRASASSSAGQCGHIIHPVCWLPNSTAMLPCALVATEQCRALPRSCSCMVGPGQYGSDMPDRQSWWSGHREHCRGPQRCPAPARYPSVPLLALTATATQRVQRDVVLQLAMAHAVNFRSSFNRANLRRGQAAGADGRFRLLGSACATEVDRSAWSSSMCCRMLLPA